MNHISVILTNVLDAHGIEDITSKHLFEGDNDMNKKVYKKKKIPKPGCSPSEVYYHANGKAMEAQNSLRNINVNDAHIKGIYNNPIFQAL